MSTKPNSKRGAKRQKRGTILGPSLLDHGFDALIHALEATELRSDVGEDLLLVLVTRGMTPLNAKGLDLLSNLQGNANGVALIIPQNAQVGGEDQVQVKRGGEQELEKTPHA